MQLLFVLFACMRLQTQVQDKPYKSQEAEEQRFTEPNLNESNQAIQNETLVVRGKREVIYNFTTFCNAANYAVSYGPPTSTSSNGCVERWYYCRGYAEPVCKKRSLQCYNIGQFGFPKTVPVRGFYIVRILYVHAITIVIPYSLFLIKMILIFKTKL